MFYTYILKSGKDGKYYYGSTKDIQRRLTEHNSSGVFATRNRRLMTLHYLEEHPLKSRARARELFFKKRSGFRWLRSQDII